MSNNEFQSAVKTPVSENVVPPRTTEEKLADALDEIEILVRENNNKDDMIAQLKKLMSYLEEDMLEVRMELKEAVARGDRLLDRINNPYKYHRMTSGY